MMGILTIPFMLLTKMAKAQDYSKMPSEVQVQMSQNKSEGKDLLSGIYVHYELQFVVIYCQIYNLRKML